MRLEHRKEGGDWCERRSDRWPDLEGMIAHFKALAVALREMGGHWKVLSRRAPALA